MLLPFQAISAALNLASARWIPVIYHRTVCSLLGVRVRVEGKPSRLRPLLIVSNHVSWLDISVITAIAPVSFIAKHEIASWPVFGLLAKLQRSIFVNRERKLKSGESNEAIAARMLKGDAVVLFAEGTSSNGDEILPFRSALIGAAAETLSRAETMNETFLQPLSIAYGGANRGRIAWYGDLDFFPHFVAVLREEKIDAVLSWGEPVVYHRSSDRKETARKLEAIVRDLNAASLREAAG